MQVTWRMLLTCREFAELAADARSVAENERQCWYERWIGSSMTFTGACRLACHRFGCASLEDVRPVALAGLVEVYRTAKYRLAHPQALKPPSRSWGKPATAESLPQFAGEGDDPIPEPLLRKRGRGGRRDR